MICSGFVQGHAISSEIYYWISLDFDCKGMNKGLEGFYSVKRNPEGDVEAAIFRLL